MHELNRRLWAMFSKKYPRYFHDTARVLEVGSFNVNGVIREHFEDIATYIGVDWRAGPCVDVVSLAHEMEFDEPFNTVASASMLEHDPYWEKSIPHMVSLMRDDGGLFLSWGGALNKPHRHDTAPDGHFHSLPVGKVITLLEKLGMYIHEFRYEASLVDTSNASDVKQFAKRGKGEVGLVAFKDKSYATGEKFIEALVDADKVG